MTFEASTVDTYLRIVSMGLVWEICQNTLWYHLCNMYNIFTFHWKKRLFVDLLTLSCPPTARPVTLQSLEILEGAWEREQWLGSSTTTKREQPRLPKLYTNFCFLEDVFQILGWWIKQLILEIPKYFRWSVLMRFAWPITLVGLQ